MGLSSVSESTDILSTDEINALFLALRALYSYWIFSESDLESIENLDVLKRLAVHDTVDVEAKMTGSGCMTLGNPETISSHALKPQSL